MATADRPYDHPAFPREAEYGVYRCGCVRYVAHPGCDGAPHYQCGTEVKDVEGAWFDANGAAGLVFYASAVAVTVVLFMTGHPLPGGIVMAIMFGVPLLLIFFREPAHEDASKAGR